MTEPAQEPDDTFPDVSVGKMPALILTILIAAIGIAVFLTLGVETRGSGWALLASAVLGAALLALAYIDLRTGLLLDSLTLPLIAAGLAWAALADPGTSTSLLNAGLGAAIGYGAIAGLAFIWRRWRGYEGIGLGDAKLLSAGGAWVGATALPMVLFVSSLIGIIAAVIVLQKPRSSGERVALPFGPCLALGIWIVWNLTELDWFQYSGLG